MQGLQQQTQGNPQASPIALWGLCLAYHATDYLRYTVSLQLLGHFRSSQSSVLLWEHPVVWSALTSACPC